MITKSKAADAVAALLHDAYPDEDIHLDLCPAKFVRPCMLLETPRVQRNPVNCNTVEDRIDLTITVFAASDDYHHSAAKELALRQEAVLELFRGGVLRVEDRAARCAASAGGMDFDRAWIDLTIVYWEKRRETETIPMMKEIILKNEVREE